MNVEWKKFIGFTNDGFGYAVISGDRAMSFEIINIYTSFNISFYKIDYNSN